MKPPPASRPGAQLEELGGRHRTGLITLLFTDMVDSTALKQRLGDRAGAAFFERHHQLVRQTLAGFPQGREIETAGDSFLLTFATPSDAVQFALMLQAKLRQLKVDSGLPASDRIGIHVGEVVIKEGQAQRPQDLYGIQIDTCARVMSLARGGQILMTRMVFDSGRQVLKGEDIAGLGVLEWLSHGHYRLKGLEEPMEVCEVREAGHDTGGPPTSTEKAQRQTKTDEEQVLGWRPGVGQFVPNTRWQLEQKLGEGGFGEVWLGRNPATKEARVFKFCFQAERVRFLKRELTLFRVLKERVGDHPHIVRLHDVYLDQPPFYVEMDYVAGRDLRSWLQGRGGMASLSLEERLEMVAQAADGLQAAHEAGIIHRDIKPVNILVDDRTLERDGPSQVTSRKSQIAVKLTDFGIGQIVSEECLSGITRAGFTQTILSDSSSSQTGTQLYMAPELLAGRPASTRSDLYSLGVVLYQLCVQDFSRAVTIDSEEHVFDPLLREDLKKCLDGDPEERFGSAAELAKQLRSLPARRAEMRQRDEERAALERTAYRRGMVRTGAVAAAILALVAGSAGIAIQQSKLAKAEAVRAAQAAQDEKRERTRAERHLYAAQMKLVQEAWEQNNIDRVRQLLEETARYPARGFEWHYWQRQVHLELKTLRGHILGVTTVAYSQDGHRIVTGSRDATAKVWQSDNGQELLTLKGHSGIVWSAAFSPDSQRIATGSGDGTIKLWELPNGKETFTLDGHDADVRSLAFSPNGQWLVSGSGDGTARVWESASGRELIALRGHSGPVRSVCFSPDGQWIATGSSDETAQLWEATGSQKKLTLKGHSRVIEAVAFSPNGQRLVTGSWDGTAKVWETARGQLLLTLTGHGGTIEAVAFSPNGLKIITGSADKTAKVWDATTGQLLFTLKGHSLNIESVAFSPNGQHLATGSEDGTVRIWEAALSSSSRTLPGHRGNVESVAFAPDGQRVVTASWDGECKLWGTASGHELVTLKGHHGIIWSVQFSPDGQRLVTGGEDHTAKVWDLARGKEVLTLTGHQGMVRSVAVSPDGQRILTGSIDGTAKVWDAAGGQEVLTFTGHKEPVEAVAFAPTGLRVVSGSWDRTAKVWDAATGQDVLTLQGHDKAIEEVAFSPDGERVITSSADGTAKLWDAVSGRELFTLEGHADIVMSAVFSPDGQRLVTGSADGTTKVWEATTGQELLTLLEHGGPVRSVAFSPEGQRLMTGSGDQTARIWEAALPEQVAVWHQEEQLAAERRNIWQREQAMSDERARAQRGQDPGAIKRWLLLAPLSYEGREGGAALAQEQIPLATLSCARAGAQVKASGQGWVWQAVQLNDYLIDFSQLAGGRTDFKLAYAVCYLVSESDQRGLVLKIGSDDQAMVFLNGREIYRHSVARSYHPDQDTVSGVQLRTGTNTLIFKVVNEVGGWEASARLTDAAGLPIKGIQVTLMPPE